MCVGLGGLGIVMPLFPTTPFLLVAVWAFSRSSPEMAERIRNHRVAGPFIRDWQDEGVIPPAAKALAVGMMAAMMTYLTYGSDMPGWALAAAGVTFSSVAVYILTRPGKRRNAV